MTCRLKSSANRSTQQISLGLLVFIFALLIVNSVFAHEQPSIADEEEIIIQLKWKHQFQFAGFYAALKQGYFADEGLNVRLKERNPSINIVDQVIRQEAHYALPILLSFCKRPIISLSYWLLPSCSIQPMPL
ncbi:ABC transporter substrate-binding protein [Nitrincola nitratireducens]|uniref:Thiamine pyrimidine synthase n=1 Tax=Nitrincola nitratireducens TaxID=1229521 RepID=W9VP42_9GAMM|nr:ABC transporter substrate-binding protein [Nitrincola nitratireducens]EXJ12245.1 NMT1/THI5 like protein [Nitrincola nitratireducens]